MNVVPIWVKATARLFPLVFVFSALSILGLLGFQALVDKESLSKAGDAVGNYLQTVGGIYAVLLAFIVFVVWGQFNDSRMCVEKEATALVDLHRTATGLPMHTRDTIQKALRAYLDDVVDREWEAMAHHQEEVFEQVGEHLDEVWTAIHVCRPTSDCQHTVYGEMLSRYNDLSDIRTSRLTSARSRMPLIMKFLLFAGAVITIGSIYLMVVNPFWVHIVMAGALGGVVAHILYLIIDLDNAFHGQLQVSKDAFLRARRTFDRAVHQFDCAA